MRADRGFSLAECIICLAAAACLFGVISIAPVFSPTNETQIVQREADTLSLWLKSKIAYAARNRVAFHLQITTIEAYNRKITLTWNGGAKNAQQETYVCEKTNLECSNSEKEMNFYGKWFTMTPAITFVVKSKKVSSTKLYVKVSVVGYVSVSKN